MAQESFSTAADAQNDNYTLDDAGLTYADRERAVAAISRIDGVAGVEPRSEASAVLFVALENGRSFDADDTPNPLDADASAYDPDGVREALLTQQSAPYRMATRPDGVVEYAVPLNEHEQDGSLHVVVSSDRRTTTTLDVQPNLRERAQGYLRRETRGEDVTPADVPTLTKAVDEAVDYITPSRARVVICEFFGFDEEAAPYGNLRDAPEEVQAEYWRKMEQIADLHAEAAALIVNVDPERAADHRRTKLSEYDAYLQAVPSEWLDTE